MPYPVSAVRGRFIQSSFVGAYDTIPNLVHVYEPARRTLTSYTGPLVRIRRSSDNAEQDFGSLANGDLDNAAITTFLGGSSPFVVTVYDQAGSNNPTQPTAGNQPAYVASGQNGKPIFRLNGTSQFLKVVFSSALSQPYSYYVVAKSDVTDDGAFRNLVDDSDSTDRILIRKLNTGTPDDLQAFSGSSLSLGPTDTNWNLFGILFNNLSGATWRNGVSVASGAIGTSNADGITVGASSTGAQWWDGDIASIVIADPSHTTPQREAAQTAINNYWAVY